MTDDTRKAALDALRQLPCPCCDGSGAYPVGDGQGGCYAEQCQWCFEREQALQALEAPSGPPVPTSAIPDSWLDPLLTGPQAVIGSPPYDCKDIERLLNAIRKRLSEPGDDKP